jgi:hypothetical protein
MIQRSWKKKNPPYDTVPKAAGGEIIASATSPAEANPKSESLNCPPDRRIFDGLISW